MKQAAFNGRMLLRKILTGLSLGAVTFIFQACYGPPPPDWNEKEEITGTVKTEAETPIPGIRVSINETPVNTITNNNGSYLMRFNRDTFVSVSGDYVYDVLFEDITYGEFEEKVVTWRSGDGPLHVVLQFKE